VSTLLHRLAACALLAGPAGAAFASALAPMDLFGLEYASDPQVAPDGARVAYVRNGFDVRTDAGRSAIWVVGRDGGGHRPLVGSGVAESSPRWSPDGTRLAYVAPDRDGRPQVFVRWDATGATAPVTTLLEPPGSLAWSPDGRWLAFTQRVPSPRKPLAVELPEPPKGAQWAEPLKAIDRVRYRSDGEGLLPDAWRQVFVVPADGGAARQLTEGDWDHGDPQWTADSAEIVLTANRRPDAEFHPLDTDLYALRLSDGRLRRLTDRDGPDGSAALSPDGRRIAWVGFDDRLRGYQRPRLYVMNLDGSGRRELLADFERGIEHPAWSADGRRILFQYEDLGRTRLAEVDPAGRLRVLADDVGGVEWSRPYTSGSFSVARDGTVAYTQAGTSRPAEVALLRRGQPPARLTDLGAALLGQRELGPVEELWLESSADRRRVQAWLVKPPGFDPSRKYPLILEIHGGPFADYGPYFAAELQLYAAAGYVVLYVNPRGSTSYGEEFANLIHHAYPGQDYDDLMSAVDAAIARGYVDPDRLFVTGGSGGGVLTAWIVGKTDRFRAAAVQKPVINWASFVLTADATNVFYRYWFPAPPWEDPQGYWARSPLSLVGSVKTPTLVVTGELDHRTPMSESEQYYQALRLRKVDTLLVRVPGAPHSLDQRPSQLAARVAYILAWFHKHGGDDEK
jgi:acylaminoacyl-peptidase